MERPSSGTSQSQHWNDARAARDEGRIGLALLLYGRATNISPVPPELSAEAVGLAREAQRNLTGVSRLYVRHRREFDVLAPHPPIETALRVALGLSDDDQMLPGQSEANASNTAAVTEVDQTSLLRAQAQASWAAGDRKSALSAYARLARRQYPSALAVASPSVLLDLIYSAPNTPFQRTLQSLLRTLLPIGRKLAPVPVKNAAKRLLRRVSGS